jgi:hypothetical protein
VIHYEPIPPRQFQPGLPRDLETICLKCLSKEPRHRYASARALAEDLRAFREGRPIAARPAGRAERLWRWSCRNPTLAGSLAAAAALLVGVAVLSVGYAVQQKRLAGAEAKAVQDIRAEKSQTEAALKDVRIQQGRAEAALIEVRAQSNRADQQRHKAEKLVSDFARIRGQSLADQGEIGRGLLWMARALEIAPAEEAAARQSIRLDIAAWSGHLYPLKATLPLAPGGGGAVLTFRPGLATPTWGDGGEAVAFHPSGQSLLAATPNGTARLYRTDDGTPIGKPMNHGSRVKAVAFSPDGSVALTVATDGSPHLWSGADGTPIDTPLPRHAVVIPSLSTLVYAAGLPMENLHLLWRDAALPRCWAIAVPS